MNRNLNRRIHPIAEADGLSPKKLRKTLNIMGKGRQVRGKVTVKRKPKLSSNKGGFLVAKVSAVNKKQQTSNG